MYLLLRWIINTLALILVSYIIPGISFENFYSALIAALVLGLINAVIRPILIVLTLPVNILTLGLFTLVINAVMFLIVSSIVKGFDITGFGAAFWGAVVYWLITLFTNMIIEDNNQ